MDPPDFFDVSCQWAEGAPTLIEDWGKVCLLYGRWGTFKPEKWGTLKPGRTPMGFDGENVGDNIIVDWSTNYDFLGQHVSTNTLSKEEYFSKVLPSIEMLKTALNSIENCLIALSNHEIDETTFLAETETDRARISDIYFEITELAFAPFECREMDTKLESFAAYLHNIWLFYSDDGRVKWNEQSRLEQSLQQKSYARQTLEQLEYELSKVR
ncbi:MAG: hypothetical protein KJ831_10735 [Candidatus Eisenbacteria bacterium]|nr:hypothetical protein [Candidatus Eisenbacteria bacterium]